MKMSGGVEWALHCGVTLTAADRPVPATRLAELHEVSSSYLAKQLQALSRAGLIRSVQGHSGGYELSRSPDQITVRQVVEAVDGPLPAFVCTEIRQRGPLAVPADGCEKPCAISRAMTTADEAWRAALGAVTIADLARELADDYGPGPRTGLSGWLRA
jgi:Rrf2 family protein